jgi:NADPH:quinone reductase-like Zn-dependent oxidoreductase
MKAVMINNYGMPEVLQYQDIEIPVVKSDEILVQVYYAGVSPFDAHVRAGWFQKSPDYKLPIILGWELSGVVVAIGNTVKRFKVGDPVFAHPSVYRNGGAYAEFVAVKESEAALKPQTVSHEQAAAVVMNALTAWQALFDAANLAEGQTVLIHAAAGGVGHLAVQLAKWKGAKVIATASTRNGQFLMDLGVDQFIDYTTGHFEKLVKDVDMVLDTIGGEVLTKSFPITKKNGIVVSLVDFNLIKQASAFGVTGINVIVEPNVAQLTQIGELMATGKIHAHIAKIFPLKEVHGAHSLIDSGHVRGKILLVNY